MKDLEYLERLTSDMNSVLEIQKKSVPNDDVLSNTIYARVRETCLSEILTQKEGNPSLSNYLEMLTKKILDSISISSKAYKTEKIKLEGRIEILESILEQTSAQKEKIIQDIRAASDGIAERAKREIRSMGDRPKTAKEKRKAKKETVEEE